MMSANHDTFRLRPDSIQNIRYIQLAYFEFINNLWNGLVNILY